MEKKNVFVFLLVVGTAFWGISFPVTKLAIGHYSSSTFLFYRFLIATLVLLLVFFKQLRKLDWRSVRIGAGLAIPLSLGIYLQTLGLQHTSASQCTFVAGTCVAIIPVLKMLFYRTVVPFKIWLAALVALSGLFIIAIKDNFTVNIGDLYTFAGAFGFAIYLIQIEKHTASRNLLPTVVPMFATCMLLTMLLALFDSGANWKPESNTFWLGIGFCALFSTAYMYTVSNISQRYISAERVAIIYLFEPLFGAVAAFFLLNENMPWRLVLGGSLIFAATLISEIKFGKWSFPLKGNTQI